MVMVGLRQRWRRVDRMVPPRRNAVLRQRRGRVRVEVPRAGEVGAAVRGRQVGQVSRRVPG